MGIWVMDVCGGDDLILCPIDRLNEKSVPDMKQDLQDSLNEIRILASFRHPRYVRVYIGCGSCIRLTFDPLIPPSSSGSSAGTKPSSVRAHCHTSHLLPASTDVLILRLSPTTITHMHMTAEGGSSELCIVMEYCPYGDLEQKIKRHQVHTHDAMPPLHLS